MSIDINWENLTGGDDGVALAETIRAFIHDRFQQVPLPRMIRSVHVHSFDFGTIAPEIELKDVSDPLPDFYDVSDDGEESESNDGENPPSPTDTFDPPQHSLPEQFSRSGPGVPLPHGHVTSQRPSLQTNFERRQSATHIPSPLDTNASSFLSRASTPGIPGGTSNMSFFHPQLSAALHGHNQTSPLAAMAGVNLPSGWAEYSHLSSVREADSALQSPDLSTAELASPGFGSAITPFSDGKQSYASDAQPDRSVDDVQVVMHLRYAGDVKMTMTADILLDYPMPSFVGIPLQIKLTGLSFDGIAIVAYIKKKAHFCFLSPEDAEALVGLESSIHRATDSAESPQEAAHQPASKIHSERSSYQSKASQEPERDDEFDQDPPLRVGGLFEDIKVESEIGERGSGKQVLKNVGKVEKFILEQVTRIFENEFVHPNFWTFLV